MPVAKTRYSSVLRAKKILIFKIRCLSISEKMPIVVVIQLSSIRISIKSLYFWMLLFVLTTKFRTSTYLFGDYFCLYFAWIVGCLCVRLFVCIYIQTITQ